MAAVSAFGVSASPSAVDSPSAVAADYLQMDVDDEESTSASAADYLQMDVDSASASGPMQLYLRSISKIEINTVMTTIISLTNDCFLETIFSTIPRNYAGWSLVNAIDSSNKIVLQDRNDDSKGVHIVDISSSSWTLCAALPALPPITSSNSHNIRRILKVAMLDNAVLALSGYQPRRLLAFTTPKTKGWIFMDGEYDAFDEFYGFKDLTLCTKDRLFYAVTIFTDKVVSIALTSSSSSVDHVKTEDVTFNLPPVFDTSKKRYRGWVCQQEAKLVDSPSDGLFLVRWRRLFKEGKSIRREVDVYKLVNDGVKKEWILMHSLPKCSFFVSSHQSIVLTPRDFPTMRCNRIYIAHDAYQNLRQMSDNLEKLARQNEEYYHIYNLKDGSWGKLPKPQDIILKNIADEAVWLIPPPKV